MLNNQIPPTPALIQDLGMQYPNEFSTVKRSLGLYKCYCGNEFKARVDSIIRETTKSCGCYKAKLVIARSTTHGLHHHKMYRTWRAMVDRCNAKNNSSFKYYGGRGITVCNRWLDINNFIEDMYPSWEAGLSLDRIDNDGNYEPSNCRWATKLTQSRNQIKIMATNTSGYRGVSFYKSKNSWVVKISVNNKRKHLGYFNTAVEGAIAYDTYIIENNLEHTTNGLLKELQHEATN